MLLRLFALLFGLLLGFEGWYAVQVWQLREANPSMTAFMGDRVAVLRQRDPDARLMHRWVPYEAISGHLKRAVVAAEDARFAGHSGFDWRGIRIALEKNLREGEVVAGGSTITQQLAKNLYLSPSRSLLRKLQEALLTVMLETMLGKRRILEIYLNVIEWGETAFGAEAAARHYFGVGAADLEPAQAALLAAILPNPRHYDRHGLTDTLVRRAAVIAERAPRTRLP